MRIQTILDRVETFKLFVYRRGPPDCGRRRDGLRVTLEDVPGSPAEAQVVLGK
jgi:hypothetical protein